MFVVTLRTRFSMLIDMTVVTEYENTEKQRRNLQIGESRADRGPAQPDPATYISIY